MIPRVTAPLRRGTEIKVLFVVAGYVVRLAANLAVRYIDSDSNLAWLKLAVELSAVICVFILIWALFQTAISNGQKHSVECVWELLGLIKQIARQNSPG